MKIFKCLFSWRVDASELKDLERSQAVVALDGPGPDIAKARIADGQANNRFARLPLIMQGNVARCCTETLSLHHPEVIIEDPDKYLDTFGALSQAYQYCRKQGWKRITLVTHPDHMWRSKKIAEHLGFEVSIPFAVSAIPYSKKGDEKKDTVFGRHKYLFRLREIAARLRDLKRGLI